MGTKSEPEKRVDTLVCHKIYFSRSSSTVLDVILSWKDEG